MRYKLLAVSGWVLAGAVVLAGAGEKSTVRTRKLVIEDEAGRATMILYERDGRPSVTLYDDKDQPRAFLSLSPGGLGMVGVRGGDGKSTVVLTVGRNGTPVIQTRDSDGTTKEAVTEIRP